MKKTKSRILASFVAVMLCFTAFSTVAFANGNDPEAKPETTASTENRQHRVLKSMYSRYCASGGTRQAVTAASTAAMQSTAFLRAHGSSAGRCSRGRAEECETDEFICRRFLLSGAGQPVFRHLAPRHFTIPYYTASTANCQ